MRERKGNIVSGLHIYKRNQGRYARSCTVAVLLILSAWGCYALTGKLSGMKVGMQFGIPVVVLVGMCGLLFWIINRPKFADFLIATEGEMKKVSWSSKKEVIGSTKVVIVTTFILAAILFLVDFVFATLFRTIGVMG
jgi:preprotein translocase subunit SecE